MDSKEFYEKIRSLGEIRRSAPGYAAAEPVAYEDRRFYPKFNTAPCPNCFGPGRNLFYEIHFPQKKKPYWRTKCLHCGQKWSNLIL